MPLDYDVPALANLSSFGGDGVRRAGVGAGEVVIVQLVLGGHGYCKAKTNKKQKTVQTHQVKKKTSTARRNKTKNDQHGDFAA